MKREATAFSKFFNDDRQELQEEFGVVMATIRSGKVPVCGIWLYQLTRALAIKNGKDVTRFPPYERIYGDPRNEGPLESEASKFVKENF